MTEQSLLAAVSGIQANQTYLDSIANNIANVNTVGYKSSAVQFQDLLAQQTNAGVAPTAGNGGVNPLAIGSGVTVSANQLNLSEGGIESTGVATDVAIQGNGYLVVQNGGQQLYTRDGALSTDANGNLTTLSGGLVMGWPATSGSNGTASVNTATPVAPLSIPTGATIGAQPTSELTLGGNLGAWSASATPVSATYNAYDTLGNAVPVTVTFTPTSTTDQWVMTATVPDPSGTGSEYLIGAAPASGSTVPTGVTVTFGNGSSGSTAGQISTTPTGSGVTIAQDATTKDYTIKVSPSSTLGYNFSASGLTFTLPAPGTTNAVTQWSSPESFQFQSANGNPAGTLKSYSISQDGTINGTFSNGQTQVLGQIALAGFANPGGLTEQGNGMFTVSGNSGQAQIGAPGTGALGSLLGGELEQSNVNLGTELTNLITAQQAYTANTKVLTTTDAALQALEQVP